MDVERSPHVVFDLGEVLVLSGSTLDRLAEHLTVPADRFAEAYWGPRDGYDLGGTDDDYWGAVGTALDRPLTAEEVAALADLDARRWADLPPASADLLDRVLAAGHPLHLLSNAPAALAARVRDSAWSSRFSTLVFSADLGLAKPDPAIYAAADARYGTSPDEVVFFDDRPVNVEAARAHGWDAHVFTGADDVLAKLI